MGGHQAGETASTLATAAIAAVFTGKSADELEAAMRAANWAVWDRAGSSADLHGMGTTMCAIGAVDEVTLAIANVGDSRAYLLRDGTLRILTTDHTVAAEMVRQGQLTEADAATHPHRRWLTRALGVAADVTIDITGLQLLDGDRLLICSDGVFTALQHDQISALLESAATPQDGADAIINLALAKNTDDNASAVVAFASTRSAD
jgi:protein phosphatase